MCLRSVEWTDGLFANCAAYIPAVSTVTNLKAGEHTVQVVCKSTNVPRLTWKAVGSETTFRSPNVKALDYVVFYGKNADEVISAYRNLSGHVPMLPLWAYGC